MLQQISGEGEGIFGFINNVLPVRDITKYELDSWLKFAGMFMSKSS